jgi:hypothetical protein
LLLNDPAVQAANTGWEGRASCDAFLLKNTSGDCYEYIIARHLVSFLSAVFLDDESFMMILLD